MIELLALLMLGGQSGATPAVDEPLTITLYAEKSEVPNGSQIGYNIVIVNHTDHKVECGDYHLELASDKASFALEITDMGGKRILHKPEKAWGGSVHRCAIAPGATEFWGAAVIPGEYPELVPGEYRIRISAQNPDNPSWTRLYSNAVSVRILPSSPKQAPN